MDLFQCEHSFRRVREIHVTCDLREGAHVHVGGNLSCLMSHSFCYNTQIVESELCKQQEIMDPSCLISPVQAVGGVMVREIFS